MPILGANALLGHWTGMFERVAMQQLVTRGVRWAGGNSPLSLLFMKNGLDLLGAVFFDMLIHVHACFKHILTFLSHA